MKKIISIVSLAGLMAQAVFGAEPALTIYNQDFAVVRDTVPLDLKSGVNDVRYAEATAHVEPDSVILRDPTGNHALQIWEQNYRNDPVTQELLLSREGHILLSMSLPFSSKSTLKEDDCVISSAAKIPAGPPPTMMISNCFVIVLPIVIV